VNRVSDLRRALADEAERLRPPSALDARVLSGVFVHPRRARRAPAGAPYRVSLVALRIVAGGVILAILLSTIVVGRLLRDGLFGGADRHPSAAQVQLAELQARPLVIPQLPAGSDCTQDTLARIRPYVPGSTADRFNSPLYVTGAGPVYWLGNSGSGLVTNSANATYYDLTLFTDPTVKGLVLVRGQQLDRKLDMFFVGPYSGGPAVGTDTISGSRVVQYSELVVPADHPATGNQVAHGWGIWKFRMGFGIGAGSCAAFQFDTPAGSEVVGILVRTR
jgi:hypothetical protein